jgi:hypothetical protein
LPYKYKLADYNGQAINTYPSGGTSATTINVGSTLFFKSVKVSYLVRILSTYGFTYSGSIFSSPDFTNLYLYQGTPTTGSTVTSFIIAMTNTWFSFNSGGGFTALFSFLLVIQLI